MHYGGEAFSSPIIDSSQQRLWMDGILVLLEGAEQLSNQHFAVVPHLCGPIAIHVRCGEDDAKPSSEYNQGIVAAEVAKQLRDGLIPSFAYQMQVVVLIRKELSHVADLTSLPKRDLVMPKVLPQ